MVVSNNLLDSVSLVSLVQEKLKETRSCSPRRFIISFCSVEQVTKRTIISLVP